MSKRSIPKNYSNVTGIAAHAKAHGGAGFESTLERDFLTLLEFSPDVDWFEVQPVAVEWAEEGKDRRYTPDVLVHYTSKASRPATLYEVKYRSDLKKNWSELKPRFVRAIRYAKGRGWRFKIISEVEIRTQRLDNARFLLHFVRQGPVEETHMELLDDALHAKEPMTATSLMSSIFSDEWNQAKLLPTLWYLVGTHQVGCDLDQPITMNSKLWYLP